MFYHGLCIFKQFEKKKTSCLLILQKSGIKLKNNVGYPFLQVMNSGREQKDSGINGSVI